jgi:hypothetical protein
MGLILLAFSAATAKDVTVAQVLAHPREFAGKRVSVTGFYVAANEESNLFTTREAAKRGNIERSIWVELHGASNFRPAVNRYVRFIGTFHYRSETAARDMHARIRPVGFVPISARCHIIRIAKMNAIRTSNQSLEPTAGRRDAHV